MRLDKIMKAPWELLLKMSEGSKDMTGRGRQRAGGGKVTVVSTSGVAFVLVLASAAFACTVYKGQMTVTGNNPGSTSVTVVADNAGMAYCGGATPTAATVKRDTVPTTPPTPGASANITVSVAASSGSCASQLPSSSNPYLVNYDPDGARDCMAPTKVGGAGIPVGEILVTGGSGTWTGEIPAAGQTNPSGGLLTTGIGGTASICVSDAKGLYGIQAPINIV